MMGKNKKIKIILFSALVLFITLFFIDSVFACSGGGGGGEGGGAAAAAVNVKTSAQQQLVFDPVTVNNQSTGPTPTTIAIDGEGPTEIDRAATISNMTAVVETLPWVGGAAVTIATAELSIPAGIVIGMAYAYGTSKLSRGSEDQSRGAAAIAVMSGGCGGPVTQIIAGEVIKALYANSPSGSSGATMGARMGAELNPNTGQVLQR